LKATAVAAKRVALSPYLLYRVTMILSSVSSALAVAPPQTTRHPAVGGAAATARWQDLQVPALRSSPSRTLWIRAEAAAAGRRGNLQLPVSRTM